MALKMLADRQNYGAQFFDKRRPKTASDSVKGLEH
jgi:hypothetical protein